MTAGPRALPRHSGAPTPPLASLGMSLGPRRTSAFLRKRRLFSRAWPSVGCEPEAVAVRLVRFRARDFFLEIAQW